MIRFSFSHTGRAFISSQTQWVASLLLLARDGALFLDMNKAGKTRENSRLLRHMVSRTERGKILSLIQHQ